MKCVICYDDTNTNFIKCSDKDCNIIICKACFEELMMFCLDESRMVMCPKKECSTHYQVGIIPKTLLDLYENVCSNYLVNFTKPQVEERNKYEVVINKIRNEKINFVKNTFNPAILNVLTIAYDKEIKKVNKNNVNLFEKMLTGRKCIGFMCKGIMELKNGVYSCYICKVDFCKECEKQKKEYHTCNQEDLESVKFVSDLVKCPTCKFPVIKSIGCNSITCAVCRTNFDYVTGEKSASGNHTKDAPLTVREHNTLYEIYADNYKENKEILESFIEIDAFMPKMMDTNTLVKYIHSVGTYENFDKKTKQMLTAKYSRYLRTCMQTKKYRKEIMKIKLAHESKVLNENILAEILNNLK